MICVEWLRIKRAPMETRQHHKLSGVTLQMLRSEQLDDLLSRPKASPLQATHSENSQHHFLPNNSLTG